MKQERPAITRLAPEDQCLTCSFSTGTQPEGTVYEAQIRPPAGGKAKTFPCEPGHAVIRPLDNGADLEIRIAANRPDGSQTESAPRLFRCGFVPGRVIAYLHPADESFADSGRAIGSPSICRAPDGSLIAAHDIFSRNAGQNLTHVYRSEDEGETWQFAASVRPCFWGSLFTHHEKLYLLGTTTEYGALVLYESSDSGQHWRGPVQLLAGGSRETGGPHKAPVPVLEAAGRLWCSVEYGSWSIGRHDPGAVSADVESDLMDPSAWQCTGFMPYDPSQVQEIEGTPTGTIEGNVLETPDGRLIDLLRCQTINCKPQYGKAYQIALDPQQPSALPRFDRTVDFPGNLSKFFIRRSPADGRYYAMSNRVTTDTLAQRNILTLSVSDDLIHWEIRRDILNYADNCFAEDESQVGFQYPSFIVDGEDLLAVVRTAVNGARNFHDANYLTFHRIRNYRR